jgi:hypothetical protein
VQIKKMAANALVFRHFLGKSIWLGLLLLAVTMVALTQAETQSNLPRMKSGAKPVLTLHNANAPRISANGQYVIVDPGTDIGDVIEVYDVSTGCKLRTIHTPGSNSAEISADGKQIAVFAYVELDKPDGTFGYIRELWIYDIETGKALRHENINHLPYINLTGEFVRSISSDLRFIANHSQKLSEQSPASPGVFLADLENRTVVRHFGKWGERDNWHMVALTPDARVLAATRSNIDHPERRETIVWDAQRGRELMRLPFDSWWLDLSADGRRLVTTRSTPGDEASVVAFSVT